MFKAAGSRRGQKRLNSLRDAPPQNWGCLPKDITASRGDIVQRQFLVLCVGLQQINWRDLASHDQSVGDDLGRSIPEPCCDN